ncbi:hypothetical protein DRO66_01845 [Candidatus Bathyarchaeota archaeon]|nr:MAG: hypothetical protein DRO66_01845 [Candidatus Bathyarchaeota archaeon]
MTFIPDAEQAAKMQAEIDDEANQIENIKGGLKAVQSLTIETSYTDGINKEIVEDSRDSLLDYLTVTSIQAKEVPEVDEPHAGVNNLNPSFPLDHGEPNGTVTVTDQGTGTPRTFTIVGDTITITDPALPTDPTTWTILCSYTPKLVVVQGAEFPGSSPDIDPVYPYTRDEETAGVDTSVAGPHLTIPFELFADPIMEYLDGSEWKDLPFTGEQIGANFEVTADDVGIVTLRASYFKKSDVPAEASFSFTADESNSEDWSLRETVGTVIYSHSVGWDADTTIVGFESRWTQMNKEREKEQGGSRFKSSGLFYVLTGMGNGVEELKARNIVYAAILP